ncbi:MAG: PAS domain S-box protein [Pseudomonadota bacterium]|nr:PAS domain S-box protein [Pseudomonadota bacterium]
MIAPFPGNEAERLEALASYQVLDTPPEPAFDDLTWLASHICSTPTAMLTLVDEKRQWFKSRLGLTARETHRDLSFCAHSILRRGVMVVPDTWEDPRFADNPLVTGPPYIRFYAGVALVDGDGFALGTVAVVDYVPRLLDEQQQEALEALGRQAVAQLELRRRVARQQAHTDKSGSVERLRLMIDTDPDCVCVVSPEGRLVEVNPAGVAMCEADSVDEVRGRSFLDLVTPECRPAVAALQARVLAGETDALSYTCVGLRGTRRCLEIHAAPLRERGRVVGILGITRDITERKRTEAALREVESRHRRLVESNIIGVVIAHLDGRITEANDGFLGMIGRTREALGGGELRLSALVPPEWKQQARESVAELEGCGVCSPFEMELFHRDGHRVPVLVVMAMLEGAPGTCICLVVDMTAQKEAETERQKLEDRFRQAQKMEAIGQLAGGVAHDFNNILAAILGNVELARADVAPTHPARVSLDEIAKAGQRARDLVRHILSFSRQQPPERRVLALRTLVEEVAGMIRATLPANVTVTVHCDPDVPCACVDETQVHQALLNLCTNAWHALEDRPGSIELRLERVEVDAALARVTPGLDPGTHARVTVRDSGKGMDPATLERIFEPFFTTKPLGQGTGLGLSVVHGIAHSHGGAVTVESEPGRGSTFALYLPVSEAEHPVWPPAAPADPASLPLGHGRHILYLDDEETLVFLVTRLLERSGYVVSGFTRPEDALAAIRSNPSAFDLVVTDFNMPGSSGLYVAAQVRVLRPDLPVAMASGYITDELRERASEVGVREVIYKPNTVEELCETIDRLTRTPAPA